MPSLVTFFSSEIIVLARSWAWEIPDSATFLFSKAKVEWCKVWTVRRCSRPVTSFVCFVFCPSRLTLRVVETGSIVVEEKEVVGGGGWTSSGCWSTERLWGPNCQCVLLLAGEASPATGSWCLKNCQRIMSPACSVCVNSVYNIASVRFFWRGLGHEQ